jgi:hypothetical protein
LSNQHRIIRPAKRLHFKARNSDLSVSQTMAKAHRVMAAIAKNHGQWLSADLEALSAIQKKLHAAPSDAGGKSKLFHIAHEIQDQAGSFGYGPVGEIGASLCQYLEKTEKLGSVQMKVIDAHIDAMRANLARSSAGGGGGRVIMAPLAAMITRARAPRSSAASAIIANPSSGAEPLRRSG